MTNRGGLRERQMNQMAIATVPLYGCTIARPENRGERPETEGNMRYRLFCVTCMMAVAVVGAAPAYADANHGAECGDGGSSGQAAASPGNAATSPGSVFNEPGVNSVNGGKGNQAYNTNARQGAGAPSQYDVGCARVTENGTGTPIQEPPTPPNVLPTDITNNARDTRAISHTGKGANK